MTTGRGSTIRSSSTSWDIRSNDSSRGRQHTKINAHADVKGSLIAIMLYGGEAHDCPVAERRIRRVKPSKRMLGDTAHDSAELSEDLHDIGTKPVIPNPC